MQVNPSTSTYAVVIGTASLAGTVSASFVAGSYVSKQYTILTTTGGLGGTTFAGLTNTDCQRARATILSYSANDVYLNLTAGFTNYTGLNINQQNVANALTNYFNTTGGIPAAFFGLSSNGLTQIGGEAATGGEKGAFRLMTDFLNLMLDMSLNGRGGDAGTTAASFAPEQQASFPSDIALAYNSLLKAPRPTAFERRWSAWGSAFGGYNQTNGDPVVGSNNVTTRDYGFAAGIDYHVSADTLVGLCARWRRHQLGPGAGARRRQERRLSGRHLWQDELRASLCCCRSCLRQSLDVDLSHRAR